MNLNLFILQDFLSIHTIGTLHENPTQRTLKRPAFLNASQSSLRTDRVYILHPSDLQMLSYSPKNIHFIFAGNPAAADCNTWNLTENEYLCTEETYSLPFIYDAVADVFELFQDWEIRLNKAMLHPQDPLQALGDCSLDIMRNPFSLNTVSFFSMYCFEKRKPEEQRYFQKQDYHAFHEEELVQEFLSNKEFPLTWRTDGPCPYPAVKNHHSDDGDNRFCLYQNIQVGGKKVLRIVLSQVDCEIRSSDYALLDIFASYVQEIVNRLPMSNMTFHPAHFDETLCSIAHKHEYDTEQLNHILTSCSWKSDDPFLCCVIAAPRDLQIGSLVNACWRLEEQIPGSCAVPDDNQIILLINLHLSQKDKNELTILIAYQLREFLMKAGYSYEFRGLENLHIYYAQASIALSYGQTKDDTLWSYHFEHYALSYMLEQCFQNIDPAIFCHHGLLRLLEYDRKKGRNYTATLRAYLENNMNIAQTIKKIYIQRASFQYQLKKILEITGANLQDYQTRLHLLLSFQLLDRREQTHTDAPGHNS